MIVRDSHQFCSQGCADETPAECDCFDDGCEYECCGCGACCEPTMCSETGKGHVWHQ